MSQRFLVAVLKRDFESAKDLIKKEGKSINVNAIDSRSGYTPLIQALINKAEAMVNYLLSLDRIDRCKCGRSQEALLATNFTDNADAE